MGPGALQDIITGLQFTPHANLLVGVGRADDAAVYQLNDQQALVQTVDFFPPIVDDPYDYGYIAAVNALSDVYAMGGTPLLALAIAAFPETLPTDVCQRILQGGIDAVAAAGAVVAGGHTIVDPEPKYGLCVTGIVDPQAVTRKSDLQVGDVLLLSKALGTGIIATAAKRGIVEPQAYATAVASMKQLNRTAADIARLYGVRCMTDVTGFGLLGHVLEMARDCAVRIVLHAEQLPVLPTAQALAEAGVVPGGLGRNRMYLFESGVEVHDDVLPGLLDVAVDPQTSGGLVMALPAELATAAIAAAAQQGVTLTEVGRVESGHGVVLTK